MTIQKRTIAEGDKIGYLFYGLAGEGTVKWDSWDGSLIVTTPDGTEVKLYDARLSVTTHVPAPKPDKVISVNIDPQRRKSRLTEYLSDGVEFCTNANTNSEKVYLRLTSGDGSSVYVNLNDKDLDTLVRALLSAKTSNY